MQATKKACAEKSVPGAMKAGALVGALLGGMMGMSGAVILLAVGPIVLDGPVPKITAWDIAACLLGLGGRYALIGAVAGSILCGGGETVSVVVRRLTRGKSARP